MAKIRHEHMSTKQKLLALAKHLKTIPDEKFNMDQWSGQAKSCGTAACALGWASTLFYGLKLIDYTPVYKDEFAESAAVELFGITYAEAEQLFMPGSYEGDDDVCCAPIPKAAVIARLREVAARY